MDKNQEIKILRSLKGDSYFSQFFNDHDIEQMCENVKNDYPIEFYCQFNAKAASLEQQLRQAKLEAINREEEMVANFIKLNRGTFTDEFYHHCAQKVGKLFIIKCKREAMMPLSEAELDYLIKVADHHINPELSNQNNK